MVGTSALGVKEVAKYHEKVVLEALIICQPPGLWPARIIAVEPQDLLVLENEGSFFEGNAKSTSRTTADLGNIEMVQKQFPLCAVIPDIGAGRYFALKLPFHNRGRRGHYRRADYRRDEVSAGSPLC